MNMNLYIVSVDLINGLYPIVLDVLSLIAIFSGVLVITTKNPIVSVLFLISLFLVIAVYLITIGVHFIGLAYLLVYIGAISILFLFTVMLINVRMAEVTNLVSSSLPLALIFSLVIFYVLSGSFDHHNLISDTLSSNGGLNSAELSLDFSSTYKWDGALASSSDIQSIGNIMYSSHGIWLIITGVILLLAMVGTITITLKPTTHKGSASKPLYNKITQKYQKGYADSTLLKLV